ncbi:hypothetical protein H2O64_19700 [Kordia sp. YSTF-M3]|uniref:DUF4595 domain-containing protein n=1 Tax=Kordia aestuariivivens TaxID=2759037 RepID=A0ABR7QEQ7_9FLAO|nr:hypothetical protein [Kordia aestuariivivens]MBC8756908.1 hypothetical protein [Kordia aestuariivivens]
MKQTFFKQVFKSRVMASVTVLLGITFLLHACSDDNVENPNTDATESIELGNENSMKLMVDGQFEKNLNSIKDVEDGIYKYVIVNSKDESIVRAFTNEDAFKNFENYNEFKSKMPEVTGKAAMVLEDYDESAILADIRNQRSKASAITAATGKVHTTFDHVVEHPFPDHDDLVGHFEFDGTSYDTHYSIELITDMAANSIFTNYHWSDIDNVYSTTSSFYLRYCLANATHSIVYNPNPRTSYVYLYTGTNRTGTRYFYSIAKFGSVEIPNRSYNTISVYNYN